MHERKFTARLPRAMALVMAVALCAAGLALAATPCAEAASASEAGESAVWKAKGQRYYCYVGGKKLTGLRTVGKRVYLFSKKGVQRTGWVKTGGVYRYFAQKNGAKGSMVTGRVVNGVKLLKSGVAVGGKAAGAELRLMARAGKIAASQTKAGWSRTRKLKAVWRWMQKTCTFRSARTWHNWSGRHRLYANDILFEHGGDCDSWAAGFAYLASACGAKRVCIVASGGHGWAEVNGKVYDLQMSGYHGYRYFAYPYSGGGNAGAPAYRSNRSYVVKLAPRKKRWSHESDRAAASRKRGLVTAKGATRYYDARGKMLKRRWKTVGGHRYWFKADGTAATGPVKVKGTRYVFTARGWLARGKKAHVVSVGGKTYRVAKSGRALSGWYSSNTRYSYANGEIATGLRLVSGKIWSFDGSGAVNRQKSAAIQAAAVVDADPAALVALLGAPKSTSRVTSCFWQTAANGTRQSGTDVTYRYEHFSVYCFEVTQAGAPDEGKTFLKSVYA